jgi:hypothetical protein
VRLAVNERVKISLGADPENRGTERKPFSRTAASGATPDKLDALIDALGKAVTRKATGDRPTSASWP